MKAIVLAILAGTMPAAAAAQAQDGMELQRCIWRCLANSPGAASAQYHQCVAAYCSGTPRTPSGPALPVTGGWTSGIAADGVTRFAGMALPDGSGRGVYFMCTPEGQSYLTLYRVAGAPGLYTLVVDGTRYPLYFDRSRVELAVSVGSDSPVLRHMSAGRVLRIENGAGYRIAELTLAGAGAAVQSAVFGCFD